MFGYADYVQPSKLQFIVLAHVNLVDKLVWSTVISPYIICINRYINIFNNFNSHNETWFF